MFVISQYSNMILKIIMFMDCGLDEVLLIFKQMHKVA